MMIEIGTEQLDAFARVWLKEMLYVLEINAASDYVHPDDAGTYEEDIAAVKRLLAFLGE
jgi:hypothetical protein